MKPHIPHALLGRAFIASNGELAWTRVDVGAAIDAYAANLMAVNGFEAWLVDRNGRWTGLLPEKGTVVPAVISVIVAAREDGERFEDFIERSKGLILAEMDRVGLENSVEPELLGCIRYNLIFEQLDPPNQSTDPTFASGAPLANEESRHP